MGKATSRPNRGKRGGEYLQTFLVIAVIGALTVTLCCAIAKRFKSSGSQSVNSVSDGLDRTTERVLSESEENISDL